ncbi:fucolectin-like [Haliotis asinina]|uniref:fucolectin-like n=1 Tax=Haliotis asinina TaxID=109174 RepID=UPI003531A4A8
MLLYRVALVVTGTLLTPGHALENIAFGKPTRQSSTWRDFVPGYGVDGHTGQHLFVDKCTHTNDTGENQPWWEVDLTADYTVESLRITNRVDCCAARLANFNVSVSHDVGGHYKLCYFHQGTYGTTTKSIFCSQNTAGRYLRIQLTGFERLTLCEVEVYGTLGTGNLMDPNYLTLMDLNHVTLMDLDHVTLMDLNHVTLMDLNHVTLIDPNYLTLMHLNHVTLMELNHVTLKEDEYIPKASCSS